jgi:hypothetical protein
MKTQIPSRCVFLRALFAAALISLVPTRAEGGNPQGQGMPEALDRLNQIQEQLAVQENALAELIAFLAFTRKEPINLTANSNIDAGGNSSFVDVFEVPEDRFLVIEYISFRAFGGVNKDRLVYLRVLTTAGGNRVDHRISPPPLVSAEIGEQQGGSKVKIYADPGTTVTFIAARGCCGDAPTVVNVSFSGYLTREP